MRDRWTDDRMDDLARHVDAGFRQVHEDIAGLRAETHEDIAGLRTEMAGLRIETREEISGLRTDSKELRRDMTALNRDLRADVGQLATREELHTLRSETQQGFDAVNGRLAALQRTLIAAILTGFIGLLATHFG